MELASICRRAHTELEGTAILSRSRGRDRWFESTFLQGRVQCEPEFPCSVQAPSGSAQCARGKRSNSRCRLCCDYRESLDSCVSAPLGGYFPICTLRDCLITPRSVQVDRKGKGMMTRTERDKMLAGDLYDAGAPELQADAAAAHEWLPRHNAAFGTPISERRELLLERLAAVGESAMIRLPFSLRLRLQHQSRCRRVP